MTRTRSWKDSLGKGRLFVEEGLPPIAAKLARVMLALTIVLVLFCGLFPFDFVIRLTSRQIERRFDFSFLQTATAGDSFENVLFFVPFGFALGATLRKNWLRWMGTAAVALGIGVLLSAFVEVMQCFLASRDPSLTDIFNNSLGCLAGFWIFRGIGERGLVLSARWMDRTQHRAGVFVLGATTLLVAAIVCTAPLVLGGDAGSLSNWNPSYAMAVGNEIGADRAWPGWVSEVHVASRAAGDAQVKEIFSDAAPADIFGEALVASYDLHGLPPFPDQTGKLPALDWAARVATRPTSLLAVPAAAATTAIAATPRTPATTSALAPTLPIGPPVEVSRDNWLRTPGPVAPLSRAIAASQQFTAIVSAAASRRDPANQARILTISAGGFDRNFSIGQEGTNLFVRVRTGTTGANGGNPQFWVTDVFGDTLTHKIVVTFRDAVVRVYIDNLARRTTARITPEAATIWAIYPRPYWSFCMNTDDPAVQALVYRGISLFLIGMLTAATVNLMPRPYGERLITAGTCIFATVIILEALLTTLAGQNFRVSGVVVSLMAAVLGVLVIGLRQNAAYVSSRWKSDQAM